MDAQGTVAWFKSMLESNEQFKSDESFEAVVRSYTRTM